MKVAIIEPHYDDCWLNVGGVMLSNPQHDYRVITISKDDIWGNNVNNTRKLSKYIPNFESIEFRYDSLDVNMGKVKQQMEEAGATNSDELFARMNGLTDQDECIERTKEAIQGYEAILLPLGIKHPMHILMRSWVFDNPTLRYLEYPYAYYEDEADNLRELTRDMQRFDYDISNVVEQKERIFREIYSSEIFVLNLPECAKSLSELDKEFFYSKDNKGEQIWPALV